MATAVRGSGRPGLSLIEDEYWYAGPISEKKAEEILSGGKSGPGRFLVRDSFLPEAEFVLCVNAQSAIWHYDVHVKPNNECLLNGYSFASLPEAINFYTENRLGSVFLKLPKRSVVQEADVPAKIGPKIRSAHESLMPAPLSSSSTPNITKYHTASSSSSSSSSSNSTPPPHNKAASLHPATSAPGVHDHIEAGMVGGREGVGAGEATVAGGWQNHGQNDSGYVPGSGSASAVSDTSLTGYSPGDDSPTAPTFVAVHFTVHTEGSTAGREAGESAAGGSSFCNYSCPSPLGGDFGVTSVPVCSSPSLVRNGGEGNEEEEDVGGFGADGHVGADVHSSLEPQILAASSSPAGDSKGEEDAVRVYETRFGANMMDAEPTLVQDSESCTSEDTIEAVEHIVVDSGDLYAVVLKKRLAEECQVEEMAGGPLVKGVRQPRTEQKRSQAESAPDDAKTDKFSSDSPSGQARDPTLPPSGQARDPNLPPSRPPPVPPRMSTTVLQSALSTNKSQPSSSLPPALKGEIPPAVTPMPVHVQIDERRKSQQRWELEQLPSISKARQLLERRMSGVEAITPTSSGSSSPASGRGSPTPDEEAPPPPPPMNTHPMVIRKMNLGGRPAKGSSTFRPPVEDTKMGTDGGQPHRKAPTVSHGSGLHQDADFGDKDASTDATRQLKQQVGPSDTVTSGHADTGLSSANVMPQSKGGSNGKVPNAKKSAFDSHPPSALPTILTKHFVNLTTPIPVPLPTPPIQPREPCSEAGSETPYPLEELNPMASEGSATSLSSFFSDISSASPSMHTLPTQSLESDGSSAVFPPSDSLSAGCSLPSLYTSADSSHPFHSFLPNGGHAFDSLGRKHTHLPIAPMHHRSMSYTPQPDSSSAVVPGTGAKTSQLLTPPPPATTNSRLEMGAGSPSLQRDSMPLEQQQLPLQRQRAQTAGHLPRSSSYSHDGSARPNPSAAHGGQHKDGAGSSSPLRTWKPVARRRRPQPVPPPPTMPQLAVITQRSGGTGNNGAQLSPSRPPPWPVQPQENEKAMTLPRTRKAEKPTKRHVSFSTAKGDIETADAPPSYTVRSAAITPVRRRIQYPGLTEPLVTGPMNSKRHSFVGLDVKRQKSFFKKKRTKEV